ncbi:MAG: Photosystem I assembly protein Ycf3 [Candidatus Marinimicrobia bacterium]|nr:Photosystem I assembly protein Ycf3 [Candidatus Neomarinimicrobiota bacterium]
MTSSDTQKSQFLELLLQVAREFGSDKVIDRFRHIKSEREKYLREQWKDQLGDEGPAIFRDVDFDHLRVLLYDYLEKDTNKHFQFNTELVKTCIQFNEYEKAREILKGLLDKEVSNKKRAKILMLMGKVALLRNEYEQSREYYKSALEIHKRLQNYRGVASAYNNLGIISHEQWRAQTGRKYFEDAKKLDPYYDDQQIKISVQINLGIVYNIQGDYSKAFEIFESLLGEIEGSNDIAKLQLLINQGISARDDGQHSSAIKILKESIKLSSKINNKRLLALSKLALGETSVLTGKLDQCNENLIDAFKKFSHLHDKVRIADTYRVFGLLHIEREQYELAESEIQISLRINNENGNIPNLAESYKAYSKLAKIRGDTAKQREYLQKALALCETMQATRRVERLQEEIDLLA